MRFALPTLGLILTAATARADLAIDNFQPAEVVRYPVVIVKGSADGTEMAIGTSWKTAIRFPVVNHKYASVVELKPGINMLLLHSGSETMKFRLDYKPMTGPYKVLATYVSATDENAGLKDRGPILQKFDTALKLMQSFTADAMNQAGYGRKTFPLELDKDGKVVVHFVTSPKNTDELRGVESTASSSHVADLLRASFTEETSKCCGLVSFATFDPAIKKLFGNSTLGTDRQALFGAGCLDWWPASLKDIPKVLANQTLPSPGKSLTDIAARETVLANASTIWGTWDPFLAARLNFCPWFQPDGNNGATFDATMPPTIQFDGDDVVIDAPFGIRVAGTAADGIPSWFVEHRAGDPPKRLKLSRKDLRSKMQNTKQPFHIVVIDDHGQQAQINDSA